MSILAHYEDALEGSFWRFGADLADVYRDRMTLRQLYVRIKALPPDSPFVARVREDADREGERQKSAEIDAVKDMVRPKPKGG